MEPIKIAIKSLAAGLLALLLLTACSGKNWFSYTGWEAKPENRAPLQAGGPHAAVWTTNDIVLHYTYELRDNRLNIEGWVERQNRIKHFHNLKAWIRIHFLDAEGVILETHRLWSQSGSDTFGGLRWQFRHSWPLPQDNQAVAFSFTGRAGDNEPLWDFWYTP